MKAVIFDLDGVICSTDEFHYLAWKKICDSKNLHFDRSLNEKLKGVSRLDCYNIILTENNKKEDDIEKQNSITKKNEYYKELLVQLNESNILEGVIYTLNKLKEKGIKIAIGSSSRNAMLILKQLNLSTTFDAISDGNNISKSKPDPEVFIKAAQKLNIKAEDCYVVEDAYSGVQAGLNAGMTVFAFNLDDINFNNKKVIKITNIKDILSFI